MRRTSLPLRLIWIILVASLTACSTSHLVPTSGASRDEIVRSVDSVSAGDAPIVVVPVDAKLVQRLHARPKPATLRDASRQGTVAVHALGPYVIGVGDTIEISVWEAPPALLFTSATSGDIRGGAAGRAVTLPEQLVDSDGSVSVPFVGRVQATGRTPAQLQEDVVRKLGGKANQPQSLVRVTRATQSMVTVVGEVAASQRLPLTARGERVLDAVAAAGGVKAPLGKVSIQLAREGKVFSLPLELLVRDPAENVVLKSGDVVTALMQPLNYTVLGATGKNDELPLEAQGISLAQALARAGGLNDNRADARGVFVFRLEEAAAIGVDDPRKITPDGKVPVVFLLDLRDPASFFAAQGFQIQHRDVLYVANAPGAELQKFLNLLWGTALPAMSVINAAR
jgi:polysaccharide biosynthesis/export protein